MESNSVKGGNAKKSTADTQEKGQRFKQDIPHFLSLNSILFVLSMEHGSAFISNSSHFMKGQRFQKAID